MVKIILFFYFHCVHGNAFYSLWTKNPAKKIQNVKYQVIYKLCADMVFLFLIPKIYLNSTQIFYVISNYYVSQSFIILQKFKVP
jgi:hypothetical protein